MKRDIKKILGSADAEKIAEDYKAVDRKTSQRMFSSYLKKVGTANNQFSETTENSEIYKVDKVNKAHILRRISAFTAYAAAFVLLIGATAGIIKMKAPNSQNDTGRAQNVETHLISEAADKGYSQMDSSIHPLQAAPNPDNVKKADIYHITLHTIDYFDRVSGTLFACTTQDGIAQMTDFNSCISEASSYSDRKSFKIEDVSKISEEYYSQCECVQTVKQYLSMDGCYEVDDLNRVYSDSVRVEVLPYDKLYPIEKQEYINIPDEERFTIDENGDTQALIMPDPTYVIDASVFLFPQNYAMGFLSDFNLWDIEDILECDGRLCYKIAGRASSNYGKKLGVDSFVLYIDCKTGVILKYEAYDEYGTLKNYLYTQNIKFDDNANSTPKFDIDTVNGYEKKQIG